MTDQMHQLRDDNGQFVSLREFVERILHEKQVALDQRFLAQQEAIAQARIVVDARLEKLNELRSEVQEDRGGYVTKENLDARLQPLEDFRSRALGASAALSLASGAAGATLAAVFGG